MNMMTTISTPVAREALTHSVDKAADALLKLQQPDGHWVFELEADATIPAEYVLMRHYLGEPVDAELERKIAVYLRRIQGKHRRLAALPRWRVRHERQREGLLRAEDDRRFPRCRSHAPRA